jgi:hypothetical protein
MAGGGRYPRHYQNAVFLMADFGCATFHGIQLLDIEHTWAHRIHTRRVYFSGILYHTTSKPVYNAEHITKYGRSRDTPDATRSCHWASIHPVSPQQMPWSSMLVYNIELWHCETACWSQHSKGTR